MNTLRLILWLAAGVLLTWVMLPIIGAGLLIIFGVVAVLLLVSIITNLVTGRNGGRVEFRTFTFRRTPTQKAADAKTNQEEMFEEEYGEDAGEVVELPSCALHKEEE